MLIDVDVQYGDCLSGFMRRINECDHVLMVIDKNYVDRANKMPNSGVGIENSYIQELLGSKPASWLAIAHKGNSGFELPDWMDDSNPKSFNFNANSSLDRFPGSEQLNDIWRWLEGLEPAVAAEPSIATIRARTSRLQSLEQRKDPSNWSSPALTGEAEFYFNESPSKTFSWGFGDLRFHLQVSEKSADSVYVYHDHVQAVGLIPGELNDNSIAEAERFLTAGRVVEPKIGQNIILMNNSGALSIVKILDVSGVRTQCDRPCLVFSWAVLDA